MKLIMILTYYSRKVTSLPMNHLPRVDPYYFQCFLFSLTFLQLTFSACVIMGSVTSRYCGSKISGSSILAFFLDRDDHLYCRTIEEK